MVLELFILICVGACAGLLSGLFGVGGGALIVPALIFTLDHFNLGGPWVTHIAIASSLATIIGTSLSSSWNHNKNHNVEWSILKRMVLGCIIGTLGGAYITPYIPGVGLKWIFTIFLIYTGGKFLFKTNNITKSQPTAISLNNSIYVIVGGLIGIFAALVGVGGGVLVVPFLKKCGINMRKAIGTSAAFTLPVAFGGAIGYIISGWNIKGLPEYSFGFIYLPAVITIMLASIPMAKVGVQIGQKLSLTKLVKFFGGLLLLIALKLISSSL
ncbi:hypothetical protein A9G11_03960 [Gilliamella sp. wkB108]|uniref:sulfite exporter TauE/SafE family protein n=1 Tax=Gilliamella sp. wkB108 TaxID=3120256 RepID=UPI00080DB2A0|nr:sulfite exporter TauE/SafE family protein [Gilliamella apicola]OCG24243.1 hypothetical protein A9G11_03960 [Gilliamella apicola]